MTTYATVLGAISQAQPIAFEGGTNLLPGDKGPKVINLPCDFSASGIPTSGFPVDLTPYFQKKYFLTVQTLYLDNSLNNGFAAVFNPTFNQSFSLPAGYQGYFSIISANMSSGKFYVTSTGTGVVNVGLINVQIPPAIWAATVTPPTVGTPQPVSDAILDATVSGGRILVTSIDALSTATDHSSTIAAGGTAQSLMLVNSARRGFLIENIDYTNSGEALWWNPTGAAAINTPGSFSLAAGASIAYPGGSAQGVVGNAISVIAATTGHKYSAISW